MNNQQLETFAVQLGTCLQQKGWYLVTAESCTGGWIAQTVTDIAGSSLWFDRGFVTYSNSAKQEMLGVDATLLEKYGAVSSQTVLAMVQGALSYSQAQVGVAVSGIAGPTGGTPDKPVGTVWIGYAFPDRLYSQSYFFQGGRREIRLQTVIAALKGLLAGFEVS